MVRPRSAVATRNAAQRERTAQGRLAVLMEHPELPDGQVLTVLAPTGVRKVDVTKIQAWLLAEPDRTQSIWRRDDDRQHPVEWAYTGHRYTIKGLAQAVVLAATGEPDADVWGYNWLVHGADGQNLGHKSEMVRQSAGADLQADDPTDQ